MSTFMNPVVILWVLVIAAVVLFFADAITVDGRSLLGWVLVSAYNAPHAIFTFVNWLFGQRSA